MAPGNVMEEISVSGIKMCPCDLTESEFIFIGDFPDPFKPIISSDFAVFIKAKTSPNNPVD